MLKKVITIALSLFLLCSIGVLAASAVGEAQQREARGGMPQMGEMPQGDFAPHEGFTPPEGEFTPPQNAGEFTPPQNNGSAETTAPKADAGVAEETPQAAENGEESEQAQGENVQNAPFGGGMPEGMGGFPGNMQGSQTAEAEQPAGFLGFVKTYATPITSVILLGLAFIFVIFYKRKN